MLLPTNKYLEHNASSEDLMLMLDLRKASKYYFPVIGEYRHQVENAGRLLLKQVSQKKMFC